MAGSRRARARARGRYARDVRRATDRIPRAGSLPTRFRAAVDDAAWLRAAWPQPATARYGATVLLGAAASAGLEHAARDLEREGTQVIAGA